MDGNQKWFPNLKWCWASQTSGNSRQNGVFAVHVETAKGQEALYIFLNYFRSFLAFTAKSTIQFLWSQNILSFVSCSGDEVVCCWQRDSNHAKNIQIKIKTPYRFLFLIWDTLHMYSLVLFLFLSLRTAEYFMGKQSCSQQRQIRSSFASAYC